MASAATAQKVAPESKDSAPEAVEEGLLDRQSCVYRRGDFSWDGELSLTNAELSFEGPGLEKEDKAETWTLPLRSVRSVEVVKQRFRKPVLVIEGVETNYELLGQGAFWIQERMLARLAELDPAFVALHPYQPDEKVLLRSLSTRSLRRFFASTGTISITNERFRYVPSGGWESRLTRDIVLDLPLAELLGAELVGLRRRLQLKTAAGDHYFGGKETTQLKWLLETTEDEEGNILISADADALEVVEEWTASQRRGPLAYPGTLVLTPLRLRFTPSRRLDALLGARDAELKVGEVARVYLKGFIDKRLRFLVDKKRKWNFGLTEPLVEFERFATRFADFSDADDPEANVDGNIEKSSAIRQLGTPWIDEIGLLSVRQTKIMAPAVQFSPRGKDFRRGWLVLTNRRVMFLPAHGPQNGQDLLMMPIDGLIPPEPEEDSEVNIFITEGEDIIRVLPRGGLALVDEFWREWHALPKQSRLVRDKKKKAATGEDEDEHNRRKYLRIYLPIDLEGRLHIVAKLGNRPVEESCRILDFSRGGVGVLMTAPLPLKRPMRLEVKLHGNLLKVPVMIRHTRKIGYTRRYGLAFYNLRRHDKKMIRQAYEQYRTDSKPSFIAKRKLSVQERLELDAKKKAASENKGLARFFRRKSKEDDPKTPGSQPKAPTKKRGLFGRGNKAELPEPMGLPEPSAKEEKRGFFGRKKKKAKGEGKAKGGGKAKKGAAATKPRGKAGTSAGKRKGAGGRGKAARPAPGKGRRRPRR